MINAPTLEQLNKLPCLYETAHIALEEKIVYLHFTIDQCHWWAMEFDGEDTFFGYVLLNGWSQDAEFGYFNLSDLLAVKTQGWIEMENDPTWIPRAVKDVVLIRQTMQFQALIQEQSARQAV